MKGLTIVALANALDKQAKPVKGNLTPGVHIVDEIVTVRVSGTITKGENGDRAATCEIPMLATLAIFIEKSGIVADNITNMLVDSMREAMLYGKDRENVDGEELPDLSKREAIETRMKDIDGTMERVRRMIGELPRVPVSGGTRCKVTVEESKFEELTVEELKEAA